MRFRKLKFLSMVLSVFLFVMTASAQTQPLVTDEFLAQFEQLVRDEMVHYEIPGVAIAVIAGDEVVYAQGFGLRDIENELPFTTQTQFRIGSTTKSMTSMLIAQLVDEGLITWDTPVTDLFPTFQTSNAELTAQITIRDLMGMNTGLISSPLDGLTWDLWDIDALLGAISKMQIGGDFREFYSYNNEVYALGGYAGVVASDLDATLDSYKTLMQTRIFDPIGMTSAIITDDVSLLSEDYAQSYEKSLMTGEASLMPNPPIHFVAPAGAVWTNLEDMAKYVITQMNEGIAPDGTRLVSQENLSQTWQPSVKIEGEPAGIENTAYGMGWVTQTYQGVSVRYHDGGWAGYSTQMVILPEDDVALIIFANASHGGLFGNMLNYAFIELLHGFEPSAVETAHGMWDATLAGFQQAQALVTTEITDDMAAYLGTYEGDWVLEQREDGSLWLNRGAWEFQLGFISTMGMYAIVNNGGAGALVTFEMDGDAVVLSVQLGEGGLLTIRKIE
mgnify:CR=1 FL=1